MQDIQNIEADKLRNMSTFFLWLHNVHIIASHLIIFFFCAFTSFLNFYSTFTVWSQDYLKKITFSLVGQSYQTTA